MATRALVKMRAAGVRLENHVDHGAHRFGSQALTPDRLCQDIADFDILSAAGNGRYHADDGSGRRLMRHGEMQGATGGIFRPRP